MKYTDDKQAADMDGAKTLEFVIKTCRTLSICGLSGPIKKGDARMVLVKPKDCARVATQIVDALVFSGGAECDDYRAYFQQAASAALEGASGRE